MVQYPAEKIAEIRDRISIEQVIGRSVRLTRRGQRLLGLCPFHSEKTPSFQVSPDKGLYHCFGCKAGGDVFKFIQELEGVDFPQAVRVLADQAGVQLPEEDESPRQREEKRKRERLFDMNDAAATYYEKMLDRAPDAMRYLTEERGLTKIAIKEFRIGWAPPGWQNLADFLAQKGFPVEDALELGLLGRSPKEGRIYDRLRGRVVFPIEVPGGRIAGFGARRADWVDTDKEGPKYLNSPESPIYEKSSILYGLHPGRDEIRKSRRAIMVEGYLDVVGTVMAGLPEAVAACGTALTPKHAKTLRRLAPEVICCYDGDDAGREATRKAAELLLSEGLSVRVVELPEGEDPDSFAQKQGAESLKKLVDEAPSAIDLFLRRARAAHAGGGVAGTTKAMEAVKPLILAIKDPLERDVAIAACAGQLGIGEGTLRKHLSSKEPLPVPRAQPQTRALSFPVVETELLKLLLESPAEVVQALGERQARNAFTSLPIQAAIDAGVVAHETGASFDAPRALEAMQGAADLDEATMTSLRQTLVDARPEKEDLSACVTRLLKAHKEHALRELKKRIEQETNPDVVRELAQEASRLMAMRI